MLHLIGFIKKIYRIFIFFSKVLSRKKINGFLEENFSSIPPGATVANIGAGGAVEAELKEWGKRKRFNIVSMDIDKNRAPDVICDITSPDLPADSYDYIVMAEVLEHVTDPHAAVRGIEKLLKPGGKLILTVPFIFPIHDRPYDHFRYTRYGLAHLFREMDDVVIHERNSWAEAMGVLAARLIMEKSVSARLISPLIVLFAIVVSPLAMLMGKLIKTDFMTTGYLLTCKNHLKLRS